MVTTQALPTGAPEILVRGVAKRFPDRRSGRTVRALEDLDLVVNAGEFVSVVGPSGCGKSTLLGLIAGFDTPTAGEIEVAGRPVLKPGPDRVMVFQDYALFPWLNTVENVEFVLRMQGYDRAKRRKTALEYLNLVRLQHVATRPIYKLSGGMRQRVALARALALKPRVLLMDEPFAALDAQQRGLMQRELSRIWAETGQTILFVTHNLDEALYLSDRVVLMTIDPGQIVLDQRMDVPRPRDVTGERFNELKRELGRLLESEVLKAEAKREQEVLA
jgi:ABC-type nitrate/sulfonate/bicarbonate transport system ATPase subunit